LQSDSNAGRLPHKTAFAAQFHPVLKHKHVFRRLHFLRESIRNLRSTGSVAPSSRFLCRAIVGQIQPESANVVVELGPGDGAVTQFILNRLRPDARLIIFEINEVFVQKIRSSFHDSRLTVIHDNAENMGQYFTAEKITAVDYFISGIPFTTLPDSLTESIIKTCLYWLRPEGKFIQFHYSTILLAFYRRIFGNATVQVVPFNIPPAIVISCKKSSP
jgi:phosphatidylethanolamine/phosphatidyl-N-methylethanolamine N-methyltransferase